MKVKVQYKKDTMYIKYDPGQHPFGSIFQTLSLHISFIRDIKIPYIDKEHDLYQEHVLFVNVCFASRLKE